MKIKLLLPLLVLLFTACGNRPDDTRPTLVVSIEPLRYVVEAVAGDDYRVTTLMPEGVSPETFEPTPRHMIEMSDAKMVFKSGTLPFERLLMEQMTANMPDVPVADLGREIEPLVDLTNHGHDHGNNGFDPHVWMQPLNLSIMAEKACQVLCDMDSVNTDGYQQRLTVFQTEMDSLDAELKRTLMPVKHRSFLIYHPALGYFAHRYGLMQLAVEHDGKEPSAAALRVLINQCKGEEIKHVFISKEHVGRGAQRVAESLGLQPATINPLDYNVPQQLRDIAQELAHE